MFLVLGEKKEVFLVLGEKNSFGVCGWVGEEVVFCEKVVPF